MKNSVFKNLSTQVAIAVAAVAFLAQSCGKPDGPASETLGYSSTSATPDFATVSKTVLQPKCLSCHSDSAPSGGVSFSNYASTMKTVTPYLPDKSMLYTAISSGLMPKGGTRLGPEDLGTVSAWILAGAPEAVAVPIATAPAPTSTPSAGPTTTPTSTPTGTPNLVASYSSIRANTLQPKCLSCHSGSGASAGVDLSTYSSVSANASRMFTAVSGGVMPPSGKLSSAEIQAIQDWIAQGKPNN